MNWTDVVAVRQQILDGMGAMANAYFPPQVTVVELAPNLIAEVQPPVPQQQKTSDRMTHMIYLHGGAYLAGCCRLPRVPMS